MGIYEKLVTKILSGTSDANISFSDICQLLNNFGREMMSKYEVIIYWSAKDEAFIAEVPELHGCMADGKTYQEAIANAEVIMQEWIETARGLNRPIPQPKGRLIYA